MRPMRPLMLPSDSTDVRLAPRFAPPARGSLPFVLGAVTLAVLGASMSAPARAQAPAPATLEAGSGVAALGVDAVNGPRVTIVSPQYNDQLRGGAQVVVAVQARKHTPRTIEMYVDGRLASPVGQPLVDLPTANFNWDTSRFADGPHRLSVVITDTQGFRGGADVNVYINNNRVQDLTPPALDWLNVRQNDVWRGLVDLQVGAADNFGVKFLIISLNPASQPAKKPAAFSWFLNRPPYAVKWDSRKAADGQYSLRATAFDALENEGTSRALNITIANHSINPTYAPPSALTDAVPSQRVNPSTMPSAAPSTSGDPNGPIELDGARTRTSAAPRTPSKAAPSTSGRRVAKAAGKTAGKARVSPSAPGRNGRPTATVKSTGPVPRVALSGQRPVGKPSLSAARGASELSSPPSAASGAGGYKGGHSLTGSGRVAALDAAPRGDRGGDRAASGASLSRQDMTNGDFSSPRALEPRQAARGAGSSSPDVRASALAVPARGAKSTTSTTAKASARSNAKSTARLSPVDRPRVSAAPSMARGASGASLSMARSSVGSRVAASMGAADLGAVGERASLSPMSPPRLPQAPARSVAGASSAQRSMVIPTRPEARGSVAAPAFPSPNLSRRGPDATPRSSAPALAAIPPSAMMKRMTNAAITVAPSITSALPALHRALASETLASVGARYGLPASVLAMHNGISEEAALKAGQSIKLPQTLAVAVGGKEVVGDVSAMMVGGMGITPFRFLFENQGGKLSWDAQNQRVTATNDTHQVTLTIGSRSALVNQKDVMMDLAAFLVSGRTMVPLRFFEKALSASVEWEPATGRMLVAMAQ